jgi:hypothetical protein
MRHKIKIVYKLLIFGIAIMLASCSEDLYEPENTFNKQGIKISKVSLKEPRFQIKSKLINQVNKVKRGQELSINANRMVFDSINNFYFDDENGMLIEKTNGYESYTFKIERETPNNYELENIVFSKIGAEYDVTLVKYELTPTELQKLESNISFAPVVEPSIEVLGKVMDCNTKIDKCVAGIDENGNYFFIVTFLDPCTGSSGSSGSDGGTGTGASTGNNTGSGSNSGTGNGGTNDSGTGGLNPIGIGTGTSWEGGDTSDVNGGLLTVPIGGNGNTPNPDATDPCTTLTNAKNNNKVQTAIDDLKTKTTGKKEFAYEIERRNTDYTESGVKYGTKLKTGDNFGVSVDIGYPIQGQAHNHPINGVAIPSWDDIFWTQECEENNGVFNNGSAFNTIVSPDPANPGGTILYSITIDNIEALQAATNAVFNLPEILAITDEKLKRDEIMKIFGLKFSPLQNDTNAQELTFLQTFANYGITLSKFNETTGKWEKLKKDPTNPNNIIKEPCS